MRHHTGWVSAAVVAVLVGATCAPCAVIKNSEYGFQLTLPDPAEIIRDEYDENVVGTDFEVSYQCGNMLYKVYTSTGTKSASAWIAESNSQQEELVKMSGASYRKLDFMTPQGTHATGIGAASQGRGNKSGLRRKFTEIADNLFGGSVYSIVLALPLNENKGTGLSLWIWGAGNDAAGVENAAKTLVESIKIGALSAGSSTNTAAVSAPVEPVTQPAKRVEVKLSQGEIAIRGVVTAIDRKKKRLDMLARQVTEYGKQPVDLDPNRAKTVLFESAPAGIQVNSSIVVVGKNTGVGKPMKASRVLVQPD